MKKITELRMAKTSIFAVLLIGLVGVLSPQQLPVIVYKLSLALLAGVAGYGLDRAVFPYARPFPAHEKEVNPAVLLFMAAQIRRALIVAAVIIAVGLGL